MGLLQHRGRVAAQGEVAEPLGDLEGASAPRQGFVQLSEVILDIHLGPIHPAAPALVSKLLDDTLGVAQILTHHSVVAERRHDVVAREPNVSRLLQRGAALLEVGPAGLSCWHRGHVIYPHEPGRRRSGRWDDLSSWTPEGQ